MPNHVKFIPAIQWHEGMMLSPQHFQQTELRFNQLLTYHMHHVSFYHWGMEHFRIDPLVLPSGIVRILEVEAIMPDGLAISYASSTSSYPLEVSVSHLKQEISEGKIYIYLCVPETLPGISSVLSDWPRYLSVEGEDIADDNMTDNVIRIPRLIPQIHLVAAQHPPARYSSFPVARIEFIDESFVLGEFCPPCFRLSQSSQFWEFCENTVKRLREKALYLCEKWQNQMGTPLMNETAIQLRPIVQCLPKIESLIHLGLTHPYHAYLGLCEIAGVLSTLYLSQIPPVFPAYNHNDILKTIKPVLKWIDLVINSIEKTFTTLLFTHKERCFSVLLEAGVISDPLFIGVKASSNMSEGDLEHWMKECIIASDSHLEETRIKRVTGASRSLIRGQDLLDLMPGRNVLIFQVTLDEKFIISGENLNIINFADHVDKRPLEIFLYLKNSEKGVKNAE